MASPSKSGSGSSSEIAAQMAELQEAIRRKDPASYLSGSEDDAIEEVLASPEPSPRKQMLSLMPRSSLSRPSTLHKPSAASSASGYVDSTSSPARSGTPTTPGGGSVSVHQRPPSSLSSSSYMSANTHASASLSRARTPATGSQFATPARASARPSEVTAGGFLSTSTRTKTPRASNAFVAPSTSAQPQPPEVGDDVRALGMEGILRYIGEVQFKAGAWAGIQLTGQHQGKGKNNGTVQG